MGKKINRTFSIRCCKCGKSVGKNLLIPARANGRTVEEAFRVITSSLCEVCKNSSISVITDPVTELNFEVQWLSLRHNSEQKPVKWEKIYEELFSIMSKEALSEYELYEKAIKKQDISNARLYLEDFTKKFNIIGNTLLRAAKNGDVDK